MEARSRSGTRSASRGRVSCSRCSARCAIATFRWGSPLSAWAAARAPRSCSSVRHESRDHLGRQGVSSTDIPGSFGPFRLEARASGVAILWFDDPARKVNLLDSAALTALRRALDALKRSADPSFPRALILTSGKESNFIAGADVNEFDKIESSNDAEGRVKEAQLLFDEWSGMPFPTIAAINGACLGGGTEIALAMRHRIAADSREVKIGLPEVPLEIIRVVGASWGKPIPEALKIERKAVSKLLFTPESKNLRHLFQMSERAKRVPSTERARRVDYAGVLGAGTMGGEIAYLMTTRDIRVRLRDIKPEPILKSLAHARSLLLREVQRGRMAKHEMEGALAHIEPTLYPPR